MKILFINPFVKVDYLNDCMYHGLHELGANIESTGNAHYMYESFPNKLKQYGRGFTVCCNLEGLPTIEPSPQEKIRDKYYDFIVYGSIHRDASFLKEVLATYPKDKILVFDGEDHTRIHEPIVNQVRYFKREKVSDRTDVESVSFSIPACKIMTDNPSKTKVYGTVVPGNYNTYIFNDEKKYYQDYASSYYGHTWKKSGWDCMRHYEILAAGCVPAFKNLDKCPAQTMTNFPKELVLKMNAHSLKGEVPPNYFDVRDELVAYTKTYLTTIEAARKVLR